MRDLSCLNTIIPDNLAAHIDLTSLKSWDLNTGFTSVSLTKWSAGFSSDIFLYDFGLTGFDNGRVNEMTDSIFLTPNDNKLKLYRVGYNNATGGSYYDTYRIIGITGSNNTSVGNYFKLNGGYLQGFFKLKNYDFQVLPARYGKGITIETLIKIEPESFNDGYFLFMGARAEDKYIPPFSGECIQYTANSLVTIDGSRGSYEVSKNTQEFSGVTTSLSNFLNSTTIVEQAKKAINDEIHTEEIEIENLTDDTYNNVIGFYLSSDKKIGYSKIDSKGIIQKEESTYGIPKTGWTIITIQFKPYDIITNPDNLICDPIRKGDLNIFVNGRLFWKIKEFDEFYFRGFKNNKEKQLGVPYNISWGGGSFGLKNSWHWDLNKRVLFDENSQAEIATGYTFINNPNVVLDCPPPPVSGYTQYVTITGDNTTFQNVDPCAPFTVTPNTVLGVIHSGTTGTTTYEYFIEYANDLDLISNRDYTFKVNFYDAGIFKLYSTGLTGLFFHGNVDIHILEETEYITNQALPYQWFEMVYKIRLQENSNKQKIRVGFYVQSDMPLNEGFKFYFDKFTFVGSDKLIQNEIHLNKQIEKIYSKSFSGGIQKLRVYDNALSIQEILHNALIESKNKQYNLIVSKGGRIIGDDVNEIIVPVPPVIPPNMNLTIQLKSTNVVNVNMVIPSAIVWNVVEYNNINYYSLVDSTKIYMNQSGKYRISYNLIFENIDIGEKIIGVTIRKNGVEVIIPYDSTSYIGSTVGYRSTINLSDFQIMLNGNDYVELLYFRVGFEGTVNLIPNGGWINIEKI
jgi:hypothetical protein